MKKITITLTALALVTSFAFMATDLFAADDSISVDSAVLSFDDNDDNGYVNIGDEVTITVVVDNVDFSTQTVNADLSDYGGDEFETLFADGATDGTDDEYSATITVSEGGAEYAAGAAGSAVSYTVDDFLEPSPVNDVTNTFGVAQGADNGVDTLAPTNQNTVFAASETVRPGTTVTIVSSGDAANDVWFSPFGTLEFSSVGSSQTTAGGTATTISSPTNTAEEYRLFVIDEANNRSAASTAVLTVEAYPGGGGTNLENYSSDSNTSDSNTDDNDNDDSDMDDNDDNDSDDEGGSSMDSETDVKIALLTKVLRSDMAMQVKIALFKLFAGMFN